MSNYTPIIEQSQPVTHYNCTDLSGNIVDNVNALDLVPQLAITYQQPGVLIGEPDNKSILLNGLMTSSATLDTSTFDNEFSIEFWVKPKNYLAINVGIFEFQLNTYQDILLNDSIWIARPILIASDSTDNDFYGSGCSLSGDANVLVVGSNQRNSGGTNRGAVYTYDLVVDAWVERNILIASDGIDDDRFGLSCSISGDANVLVVGAILRDSGGTNRGAVYTYDLVSNAWVERNILIASDGTNDDFFGISSTLSNDATVLVVGTHARNSGGTDRGAVYTYDLVAGAWVERNILIAGDGVDSDGFGVSSTLSSDATVLVVGSYLRDSGGISNSGAVYTYDLVAGDWVERNILTASDGANGDEFGRSCSISSDTTALAVGSPSRYTSGTKIGAVYNYDLVDNAWVERNILIASDGINSGAFGDSISLSNLILAVSLPVYSAGGLNRGGLHVYDFTSTETSISKKLIKDQWNHMVLNYNGTKLDVIKNSELLFQEYHNYSFDFTSSIGISGNCPIDEIVVYDRELSNYEIKSHYNNSKSFDLLETSILDSNPSGYFPMDDVLTQMESPIGTQNGEYINNPTYSNTNGKHGNSVLFDGVDQHAIVTDNNYYGIEIDPYFDNVALLLHMDGDNNSTTFVDYSKNNNAISVFGNTHISTNQGKFNTATYFDGVGDYLTFPYDQFNSIEGSGDFTIEMWVYPTIISVSHELMTSREDSSNAPLWLLRIQADNRVVFGSNDQSGGAVSIISIATIQLNVWQHISVVKLNKILKIYINGVNNDTVISNGDDIVVNNIPITIGCSDHDIPTNFYTGYIDELRITIGVARYTENFTPASKAFSHLGSDSFAYGRYNNDEFFDNVELLLHMDGTDGGTSFIDSSKNKEIITKSGTVSTSNTELKFGETSAYADGTQSAIIIPLNDRYNTLNNDFTFEFNVFLNGFSANAVRIWSANGDFYTGFNIEINASGYIEVYMSSNGTAWNELSEPTISLLSLNTWYHIALVRQAKKVTLYINGVGIGLSDLTDDLFLFENTTNDYCTVGQSGGINRTLNGYLDEVRLTVGVARYTTNFAPPLKSFYDDISLDLTAMLDTHSISDNNHEYDPHFNKVSALLHFDGIHNSTKFRDVSLYQQAITKTGNPLISTTKSKFGNTSCYFDGVDDRLELDNKRFDEDFTIEMWFNCSTFSTGALNFLVSQRDTAPAAFSLYVINSGHVLSSDIWDQGQVYRVVGVGTTAIQLNTWHHVALCKDGSTYYLFTDGVLESTVIEPNKSSTSSIDPFSIGGIPAYTDRQFNGYIDDFRFTGGVARYTESFTPPIRQYPEGPVPVEHQIKTIDPYYNNVSLLLHMNGHTGSQNYVDNSKYNHNITVEGSRLVNTPNVVNQSGHFNIANKEYIKLNNSNAFDFGTGDFTVEAWVYILSNTAHGHIFSIDQQDTFTLKYSTSDTIFLYANSATRLSTAIIKNQWIHVAVSRTNGLLELYIDGLLKDSVTYTASIGTDDNTNGCYVGSSVDNLGTIGLASGVEFLNGYLSELRVTKGIGRYTTEFKPPLVEFAHKSETLAMSQELWFNAVSVSGGSYSTIFSKGSNVQNSLVIKDSTFSTGGDIHYYYKENEKLTYTGTLALNVWYHMVITQTNNEVKMYLNGEIIAENNDILDTTNISNESFYLASDIDNIYPSNIYVDGYILSNRLFNEYEIKSRYDIYNGADASKAEYDQYVNELAPYHYYKLSEYGSTHIIDEINEYNGTLEGPVGTWGERNILTASDGLAGDRFGVDSDVSMDGQVLVVAANSRDGVGTDRGAVYTYDLVAGAWVERNILIASDGINSDYFGSSCSLSDDATVLVVGARGRESGGINRGAVYTYDLVAGDWVERNILIASDGVDNDFFGISCSISKNEMVLVVGAFLRNSGGVDRGAVYTFDLVAGAWVERNITIASDGANGDSFGISSSLSNFGLVMVVGAYLRVTGGTVKGSVYTYDLVGNDWVERNILIASDGVTGDGFGECCEISDGGLVLAVGSHYRDSGGTDRGAVYTYDWVVGDWVERNILIASDGVDNDLYGRSCSLSGTNTNNNILTVGSHRRDLSKGAIYTYDLATIPGNTQQSVNLPSADKLNKSTHFREGNIKFYDTASFTNKFSITLWVKVTKFETSALDTSIIENNAGSYLYITNGTNELSAYNGSGIVNTGFIFELDKSYHIIMNVTSSATYWYVDGVKIHENMAYTFPTTGLSYMGITNASDCELNIDEVMIFDNVNLTEYQISKLYKISTEALTKNDSYNNLLDYILPTHYYRLDDLSATVVDAIAGYNGTISGNTYLQENSSILYSDIANKATLLTDASITFDNSLVFDNLFTYSFIMTLNDTSTGNIIYQTSKGGVVLHTDGTIRISDGTNLSIPLFKPEISKSYYYTIFLDTTNMRISLYIDGRIESITPFHILMDGYDSFGEDGFNIKLDEISVFNSRLSEFDINKLFNRATHDRELSIAWKISGVTQILGADYSVDLRLYHHDTGGLLSQIKSNSDGTYEFLGLYEGVRYDVVAWDDADPTTCQYINMSVFPESYTY